MIKKVIVIFYTKTFPTSFKRPYPTKHYQQLNRRIINNFKYRLLFLI